MPVKATTTILSPTDPTIHALFPPFLSPTSTPPTTTLAVTQITQKLLAAFLASPNLPPPSKITLIPVLRAALPMYVAASPLFPESTTVLVRCFKDKAARGADSVRVEWMGRDPTAGAAGGEQRFVILDTVMATGATVVRLCDELSRIPGGGGNRQVSVLSCYASPEAIAAVAAHPVVDSILVARRAEGVDEGGYLVPGTGGDVGDRLFGKREGEGKGG